MNINKGKIKELAQRFIQKGQIEKAIDELTKLVQKNQKDVRLRLRIGDLYIKLNKKNEAIREYLKAAEIYEEKDFNLNAIAVYKQILKIDPSFLDIHLKLATLYEKQGLIGDALNHYRILLEVYEKENNTRGAIDLLLRMKDIDPANKAIRMKLVDLYLKSGLKTEALGELKNFADFLKYRDRIEDVLKIYEKILSLNPYDLEIIKEFVNILKQRGNVKDALEFIEGKIRENPEDIRLLNLKADFLLDQNMYDESEEVSKRIKNLDPKNIENLERLLKIYKIKEDEESLFKIYTELAEVYEERKEFDKSKEIYELIRKHKERLWKEEEIIEPLTEEKIEKELEALEGEEALEEAEIVEEGEIEVVVETEEEKPEKEVEPQGDRETQFFDLKKELEEDIETFDFLTREKEEAAEEGFSFEEIFKEFKKGVEKEIGKEDSETHYNLGIAYKEMGLIDDAINEFNIAMKDPKKVFDASIMLALCYKELRRYEEAISVLKNALNRDNLPKEEILALTYELGVIYETMGDREKALEAFNRVNELDSNYRNVKSKLSKKSFPQKDGISSKKKDRISYV